MEKVRISSHLTIWAEATKADKDQIEDEVVELTEKLKNLPESWQTVAALEQINKSNEEAEMAKKSSCRAGCSHCCYQGITVTDEEAQLIAEVVDRYKIDVDMKQLKRQKDWGRQDYFRAKRRYSRCAFLIDNECSIYEARPAACRNFFVSSEPENCKNKYRSDRRNYPIQSVFNPEAHVIASALYTLSETKPGLLATKMWEKLTCEPSDEVPRRTQEDAKPL